MSEQVAYTTISRKQALAQGLEHYYTSKPCKNGHLERRNTNSRHCLGCLRDKSAEDRKVNPDRGKEYLSRNREVVLTKKRLFYKENRDRLLAENKLYRDANKERLSTYRTNYQKSNPAFHSFRSRTRDATKLRQTPFWSDLQKIKNLYEEASRISESTGIKHHVDHIVPLRHKLVCGLHVPANLQIITAEENLKKGNKFEIE